MSVITRFAPSPTGYLHIGGARTALFNWLFAKHHGGKFMLRIEDTDRARSTDAAIDAILYGMKWLGLQWDDEPIFQFSRMERHAEVAHELVKEGKAYYCYCTPEELTAMREEAQKAGKGFRYDGRWRDRDPKDAPAGIKPAIRIKAPLTGEVITRDHVQGDVRVAGDQLDDMVILRSDGTPTYMLAVVVDDHDMGVTHIIRGDDHLTNAARQQVIYDAMGWKTPEFAHIPLIHGADGAKLSKRHGALGVEEYEKMGYLPEALRNYLLRLGWSHGDDEIISTQQAIEWFGLEAVGKSPSRFDFVKLENLNGHYMREADDVRLTELILPRLKDLTSYDLAETGQEVLKTRIVKGMNGLKQRAKNLNELAESAVFYLFRPPFNEKAAKLLEGDAKTLISNVAEEIAGLTEWTATILEAFIKEYAERSGIKLGNLAQPLRAALTGSNISPSIFEVMEVLGKDESLARLGNI